MITQAQMAQAMPVAASTGRLDLWYPSLAENMVKYDIAANAGRQCGFLANTAEETGEFAAKEENLHYSGERLRQVYPIFFANNAGLADRLAAQGPEAIANYIYADVNRPTKYRLGNVAPRDGWNYRGRGPMQLTGRSNYEAFFRAIGLPPDTDPDEILKPSVGAMSAAFYWKTHGCNELMDAGNFTAAVERVNGGTINMPARQLYLERFQQILGGH